MKTANEHSALPREARLVVAHEGWSTGSLSSERGRGAKKFWSREMISALTSAMKRGTPLFLSHADGARPRRRVGEIVSAAEHWVKGRMSASALCAIDDPEAAELVSRGELDTCSLEAEVECSRGKEGGNWIVGAVRKVTGVALGDSRVDRPGFSGASVLCAVQEFGEEQDSNDAPADPPDAPPPGPDSVRVAALEKKLEDLAARLVRQEENLKRLEHIPSPPERPSISRNPLIPGPRNRG